jgi:hypothetical protein
MDGRTAVTFRFDHLLSPYMAHLVSSHVARVADAIGRKPGSLLTARTALPPPAQ